MYCRECGEQITNEKAVICIKCATNKGQGEKFCPDCGVEVKNKGAEVCLNCGIRLKGSMNNFTNQIKNATNNSSSTNNNNKIVAGLLSIFLGAMGIHRFYLGYKEIGFMQLGLFAIAMLFFEPVLLGCWIWAIIDAIQIFTGKLPNSNGTELV
ncbi:TM2 domain-containing protein [Clostridium gasigenes]|uniref:TM2 domain-containing membrane protein YozV n=1 Tax=Clostridium gasigenes TaxID=94869 RepID=A0A1H0V3Q3_9CLOT|nr:TM2 domain-containing protein [Clostridium gasigenes]SDP73142.1 TM2 domain-containing membrane protein YozV [Clostridium gasigenes]